MIHNIFNRALDDREKRLQEGLQRMEILEREIAAKDTEVNLMLSTYIHMN